MEYDEKLGNENKFIKWFKIVHISQKIINKMTCVTIIRFKHIYTLYIVLCVLVTIQRNTRYMQNNTNLSLRLMHMFDFKKTFTAATTKHGRIAIQYLILLVE